MAARSAGDGRAGPGAGFTDLGVADHRFAIHDAESDADLDAVVSAETGCGGPVLWVGSGGLAAALARRLAPPGAAGGGAAVPPGPLLCLIGSRHPVSLSQIAHAEAQDAACRLRLLPDGAGAKAASARIENGASTVVTVEVGRSPPAAAIAAGFTELLRACPRPGAILASGGETLRDVADALGASGLAVAGEIEPGLPLSHFDGGRYNGLPVISKSGAFGRPELLAALISRVHGKV